MFEETKLKTAQAHLKRLEQERADTQTKLSSLKAELLKLEDEGARVDPADDGALEKVIARQRGVEDRIRFLCRRLELGSQEATRRTAELKAVELEVRERELVALNKELKAAEGAAAEAARLAAEKISAHAVKVHDLVVRVRAAQVAAGRARGETAPDTIVISDWAAVQPSDPLAGAARVLQALDFRDPPQA